MFLGAIVRRVQNSAPGEYNTRMTENSVNEEKAISGGEPDVAGRKAVSGRGKTGIGLWAGKLGYAFRGLYLAFLSERSFRFHILALCLVVIAGIFLRLSAPEWCLVIFAIGFVLVSELFNTAVERLGDEASGGVWKKTVKNLKDISAAAVLVSALTAAVIGVIVLLIPLVEKLFG